MPALSALQFCRYIASFVLPNKPLPNFFMSPQPYALQISAAHAVHVFSGVPSVISQGVWVPSFIFVIKIFSSL